MLHLRPVRLLMRCPVEDPAPNKNRLCKDAAQWNHHHHHHHHHSVKSIADIANRCKGACSPCKGLVVTSTCVEEETLSQHARNSNLCLASLNEATSLISCCSP